jgi:predicted PurR-regulated permease PerM
MEGGKLTERAGTNVSGYEIAAWVLSAAALFLILHLHLLSALLSGLLVYELVHILTPFLRIRRLTGKRAKLVVVALLAVLVVLLLVSLIWGSVLFFRNEPESISALLKKMAEIIDGLRGKLPGWLVDFLPGDVEDIRTLAVGWLHEHAGEVQTVGRKAGRITAHVLIGLVIGGLISLREASPSHKFRPLAGALVGRISRMSDAFRLVVFAQIRISAINTVFAALYLAVLLPLLGIHLPLVKTMIAITFVTGLLPVVGNLISNSIITVVSLSHSPSVALGSLVYLVLIHKLEYFLNARIIGSQIRAHAWELLVAMLVMEAAFGISGVIAAPIYYAYIKSELSDRGLV